MSIEPYQIIEKLYPIDSLAFSFLVPHSEAVANFAISIAERISGVDTQFVYEAAMLHDIGICFTHAPGIGCHGNEPYVAHGILGEAYLQEQGLQRHAAVSRTHVGVALTASYIAQHKLPLPAIDMVPSTEEECIVAYADKFFSKNAKYLITPKSVDLVIDKMKKFGDEPVAVFREWHERYC